MKDTAPNLGGEHADETVIACSRTSARGMILSVILLFISVTLVLVPRLPAAAKLAGASLALVGGVSLVIFSGCFCRKGRDKAGGFVFWTGLIAIWISTAFDIGVTVHFSPDLAREGNPVFRILLDQGLSLAAVYAYIFAILLGSCVFLSLCWFAVFRHRGPWLRKAFVESSGSAVSFMKAAGGGSRLSWRQFLLALRWSERPQVYETALAISLVLVVFVVLGHTRAGLEWINAIPRIRLWRLGLEIPTGIAFGLALALRSYRRMNLRQPRQTSTRRN